MIEVAFIFTAAVILMASVRIVGLLFGRSIAMPNLIFGLNFTDPGAAVMLYPSVAFQLWFWTNHYGLF